MQQNFNLITAITVLTSDNLERGCSQRVLVKEWMTGIKLCEWELAKLGSEVKGQGSRTVRASASESGCPLLRNPQQSSVVIWWLDITLCKPAGIGERALPSLHFLWCLSGELKQSIGQLCRHSIGFYLACVQFIYSWTLKEVLFCSYCSRCGFV